MDEEHTRHLERILAGRRRRGVPLASRLEPPAAAGESHVGSPSPSASSLAVVPEQQQQQEQQEEPPKRQAVPTGQPYAAPPQPPPRSSHATQEEVEPLDVSAGTVSPVEVTAAPERDQVGGGGHARRSLFAAPPRRVTATATTSIDAAPPGAATTSSAGHFMDRVSGLMNDHQQQQQQQQPARGGSSGRSGTTVPLGRSSINTAANFPSSSSSIPAKPSLTRLPSGSVVPSPQPQPQQQQQQRRPSTAAATTPTRHGSAAAAAVSSSADGGGSGGLFQAGKFDNFHRQPSAVAVDPAAIRPYRSDSRVALLRPASSRDRSPTANSGHWGGGGDAAAAAARRRGSTRSMSPGARRALAASAPITEPNPFRTQTYEAFVAAPDTAAPTDLVRVLERARDRMLPSHNHRHERLAPPNEAARLNDPSSGRDANGGRAPTGNNNSTARARERPVYSLEDTWATLTRGDWFLKWTRHKNKVHRRYFWAHPDGVLYWAKIPHATVLISSSIRFVDIVDIETTSDVDPETGRTYYILRLWTGTRAAMIGTELRDKFDLWFEALSRLSAAARENTRVVFSRHATMKPVVPVQRPVGAVHPSD